MWRFKAWNILRQAGTNYYYFFLSRPEQTSLELSKAGENCIRETLLPRLDLENFIRFYNTSKKHFCYEYSNQIINVKICDRRGWNIFSRESFLHFPYEFTFYSRAEYRLGSFLNYKWLFRKLFIIYKNSTTITFYPLLFYNYISKDKTELEAQ